MLCPAPGDLPNLGIKSRSSALQADSLSFELPGKSFIFLLHFKQRMSLLQSYCAYNLFFYLNFTCILGLLKIVSTKSNKLFWHIVDNDRHYNKLKQERRGFFPIMTKTPMMLPFRLHTFKVTNRNKYIPFIDYVSQGKFIIASQQI